MGLGCEEGESGFVSDERRAVSGTSFALEGMIPDAATGFFTSDGCRDTSSSKVLASAMMSRESDEM